LGFKGLTRVKLSIHNSHRNS